MSPSSEGIFKACNADGSVYKNVQGGQFISAGGEMSVGDYRLRLTLGAREPIHRMRTPNLRLRPISLGRTP